MAGLFGTKKQKPEFTGLQIQTSALTLPIPIVYGTGRLAGNLIWYNDFQATTAKGSGKGGSSDKQFIYKASYALAICEGPVVGPGIVFANSSTAETFADSDFVYYSGATGQAPAAFIESEHPDQALSYTQTAYMLMGHGTLGSAASVPAWSFEIQGFFENTAAGGAFGYDADMSLVVPDFLTNPQYGVGLSSSQIGDVTAYQTYTRAVGLFLSPVLDSQEQASQIVDRWAQLTNTWIFWNGLEMKFVPLGTDTVTGNGVTYTPNLTAVFSFGMDDFIIDGENTDPVEVDIKDPSDAYNTVKLDCSDRFNRAYETNPVEWKDEGNIALYGQLNAPSVEARDCCNINVGQVMAQLIGQRACYILRTYKFKVGYEFVAMEVGDIIEITEPNIGLSLFPARIQELEEDDKGAITVTAEELPYNVASPTGVATPQASSPSFGPNYSAAAPAVNAPGIFEPSPTLTGGVPQVWIGASGPAASWGGCYVWLSIDGTTYSQVGEIDLGTVQGLLTANLPATADPDTTDTLSVNLAESTGTMPATATHADADDGITLALIDSEVIAYGAVATGSSATAFNLTYLRRGQAGTTVAAHSTGATFTRLDSTVFQYDLPKQWVGATLYLKLQSFNPFGGGVQDLSACTAYTYTPTGVGYTIAPPTSIAVAPSRVTQADGTTILAMTASWTASAGPLLGSYDFQWSTDGGTTWTGASCGPSATSYVIKPAVAQTSYLVRARAISQNGLAVSAWDTSAATSSGALVAAVPAAPAGLAGTATAGGFTLTWTASTDATIQTYQVWAAPGASQPFADAAQLATLPAPATDTSVTGLGASPLTVFLVATNAAGSSAASSGVNVTPLAPPIAGTTIRFYFAAGQPGVYAPGESFFGTPIEMAGDEVFPASLTGTLASCAVAPAGNITCPILANGTQIGSINFASGATTGTATFASARSWSAGDLFDFQAPTPADPAFSLPRVTFVGTRS